MACEICGRGNCTKSFHSIEEQQSFDAVADAVKDRIKTIITNRVDRLDTESVEGYLYVKLSDVLDVIDNAE